jgi:hypothetical protein
MYGDKKSKRDNSYWEKLSPLVQGGELPEFRTRTSYFHMEDTGVRFRSWRAAWRRKDAGKWDVLEHSEISARGHVDRTRKAIATDVSLHEALELCDDFEKSEDFFPVGRSPEEMGKIYYKNYWEALGPCAQKNQSEEQDELRVYASYPRVFSGRAYSSSTWLEAYKLQGEERWNVRACRKTKSESTTIFNVEETLFHNISRSRAFSHCLAFEDDEKAYGRYGRVMAGIDFSVPHYSQADDSEDNKSSQKTKAPPIVIRTPHMYQTDEFDAGVIISGGSVCLKKIRGDTVVFARGTVDIVQADADLFVVTGGGADIENVAGDVSVFARDFVRVSNVAKSAFVYSEALIAATDICCELIASAPHMSTDNIGTAQRPFIFEREHEELFQKFRQGFNGASKADIRDMQLNHLFHRGIHQFVNKRVNSERRRSRQMFPFIDFKP